MFWGWDDFRYMNSSAVREAINILARASARGPEALAIAAQAMAEGLDCRWAGIAVLTGDGASLDMLAVYDGAATLSVGQCPLRDAAAVSVYKEMSKQPAADADGSCLLRGDLARRFPSDPVLAGRKIRFFAAALFKDRDGRPAGHVFVMDDKERSPDGDSDAREFLGLVACRVGGDIANGMHLQETQIESDGLSALEVATSVISWGMDPALERISVVSRGAEALLGYSRESWNEKSAWRDRVHVSDRERVFAALTMARDQGTCGEFEFRMCASDGRIVWVWGVFTGAAEADEGLGVCGLWFDLTRQKTVQRELADTVRRFRDFAEAGTDWLWEMDENLRFSFLSEQFQNVTGVEPAALIGRDRRQLLAMNDAVIDDFTTEEDWEAHIQTLEAHEPFQDFRHTRPAENGQNFYLSISGKPVFGADGKFVGYRGTGSNITEQVRMEKALRESERQLRLQSDRAEEASRAKSEFLANMSHEIRTPLNAILGFSDSMQREILGPMANAKYKEYASAIHVSGCHLLELVNDVLDLSKIEAGRYVLSRRTVELTDVVEGCLQITKETANRKSIDVVFDAPKGFPPINADLRAIKQVMLNLMTNALKYTEAGGRVTISLEAKGGDVFFQVADTGIGIPEEDIATLTEAFVQGRSNQAYLAHEGTGLGLAITESLVQMHGGFLTIESEVGVGTVVKVSLPNAVEVAKAAS